MKVVLKYILRECFYEKSGWHIGWHSGFRRCCLSFKKAKKEGIKEKVQQDIIEYWETTQRMQGVELFLSGIEPF